MSKHRTHDRKQGFTLLELLVATAISVLVLGVIVRVVVVTLQQTERSVGAVSRSAESNNVRRYLEADLQSIVTDGSWVGTVRFQAPGFGWGTEDWHGVPHEAKPELSDFSTDPDVSESMLNERWGREGVQAMWFVQDPLKSSNDPGGLKAVAYQIKRKQLSNSDFPRYYLMRSEVSAGGTLLTGYQLESGGYDQGSFSETAFWSPTVLRYPNQNHIIASNVIDFGLRVFEHDSSTGQWFCVFPGSPGVLNHLRRPLVWVVMLRVLSDEGADLIENIEQGRSQDDWWKTAIRHSEVLSFRVYTM